MSKQNGGNTQGIKIMFQVYSASGIFLGSYHNAASLGYALKNQLKDYSNLVVKEGFANTH